MSRGFGRLERGVMALIERTSKPMTFVAIRAAVETKLRPTFDERSRRRAVHRLTEKCMLIAMGITQALREELVLSDWDLCLWLSNQIALTAVVDEAYRLN
jgi:hypothetical protein